MKKRRSINPTGTIRSDERVYTDSFRTPQSFGPASRGKIIYSSSKDKICNFCKVKMVIRTASKGVNKGNKFWGCSRFPKCRNTINDESLNQKTI